MGIGHSTEKVSAAESREESIESIIDTDQAYAGSVDQFDESAGNESRKYRGKPNVPLNP
jgi:hypothetical protein